jgi:hypothetical protein
MLSGALSTGECMRGVSEIGALIVVNVKPNTLG